MQAHTATASQCIPQLEALREDYGDHAVYLVPQRGVVGHWAERPVASLDEAARVLAAAISEDIQ
eukprot:7763565-Lingulodinium_polyedra.AAC.1